jgi:hypothetical protein
MSQPELIEGVHFYINKDGYIVFTEKYHLEKGICCGMGCLHCPYNYENVPEPRRSLLLTQRANKRNDLPHR